MAIQSTRDLDQRFESEVGAALKNFGDVSAALSEPSGQLHVGRTLLLHRQVDLFGDLNFDAFDVVQIGLFFSRNNRANLSKTVRCSVAAVMLFLLHESFA